MALLTMPDVVKQRIWRYLDARELCRVDCITRGIARGANADAVWKRRAIALIASEHARVARPPIECGLQRQNARRDVTAQPTGQRTSVSSTTLTTVASMLLPQHLANCIQELNSDDSDARDARIEDDSTFWRDFYRDCFVSTRSFAAASSAFETAKADLQELQRTRKELRELVQSIRVAGKRHKSDAHVRRVQLSCVRWMNRSHRREAASASRVAAAQRTLALPTNAELTTELERVEQRVLQQTTLVFALRSQYQKHQQRTTKQLARSVHIVRDLCSL